MSLPLKAPVPNSAAANETAMAAAAAVLDQAASQALDLVREFAEHDPLHDDDDENPWQNPSAMLQQLEGARSRVVQAVQTLQNQQQLEKETEEKTNPEDWEEDLRAQFMDMITEAFGGVLQDMQQSNQVDVDVLADCLQSGIELMSHEEREFFMRQGEDDDDSETMHELARQNAGFGSTVQ